MSEGPPPLKDRKPVVSNRKGVLERTMAYLVVGRNVVDALLEFGRGWNKFDPNKDPIENGTVKSYPPEKESEKDELKPHRKRE